MSPTVASPRLKNELHEPVRPICVGLEPADLARLDALSLAQGVNRSALVRKAIKRMLATKQKSLPPHSPQVFPLA